MKVFNTYIAGVTFNNDDGSNRKQILATLQANEELMLEQYLYEGSKAVRILTQKGQMVGNIPKDFAEMIYNAIENNAVYITMYNPEFYEGVLHDESKDFKQFKQTLIQEREQVLSKITAKAKKIF